MPGGAEFRGSVRDFEDKLQGSAATKESESEQLRRAEWQRAVAEVEKMPVPMQLEAAMGAVREFENDPSLQNEENELLRQELQHTLWSVENAKLNLETDGPNKGKYKVEIKDGQGNVRTNADGSPMLQYEGIPVDALADALIMRSNRIARDLPQRAAEAKRRYEEMRRKFDLQYAPEFQPQHDEVAVDPVELRKLERESQRLQREAADPALSQEVLRLRALAAGLENNSVGYFKAHFGKETLTPEESARQHFRTEHEAFLISNDVRHSYGEPEKRMQADYAKAMQTMSARRELVWPDQKAVSVTEQEVSPEIEHGRLEPEPLPEDEPAAQPKKIEEDIPPEIEHGRLEPEPLPEDEPTQPQKPAPLPTKPEPAKAEPTPEPQPEPAPEPEPERPPLPDIRASMINMSDQAELLARYRADREFTDIINEKTTVANFFKKMWYRALEAGYRQKMLEEQRAKIYGEGSDAAAGKSGQQRGGKGSSARWADSGSIFNLNEHADWVKRAHAEADAELYGKKFQQQAFVRQEKNLFGDPALLGEYQAEARALMQRFQGGYINTLEGESKEVMSDPQFQGEINDLVYDYATPQADKNGAEVWMSDEDFDKRKAELGAKIAKRYPNYFEGSRLNVDNFLEAARAYRNYYQHSKNLRRLDVNLELDLGIAKRALKTEANLTWVDKQLEWMQQSGLSTVISPTIAAFGLSIAGYFARKPATALLGAAGAGGIFASLRRHKDLRMDRSMHNTERAMGFNLTDYGDKPNKAERRAEMERFTYETLSARQLTEELNYLRQQFAEYPTPENGDRLMRQIAECETRMAMSEENRIDLVSYDGETQLERGRLLFMKTLAESKLALNDNRPLDQAQLLVLQDMGEGARAKLTRSIQKTDKEFASFSRREVIKAGVSGAVLGATIGALVQEGFAKIGDATGLPELRPGGRQTAVEHLYGMLNGNERHLVTYPPLHRELGIYYDSHRVGLVRVPEGMHLVHDKATGFDVILDRNGNRVVDELQFDRHTGEMLHGKILHPDVMSCYDAGGHDYNFTLKQDVVIAGQPQEWTSLVVPFVPRRALESLRPGVDKRGAGSAAGGPSSTGGVRFEEAQDASDYQRKAAGQRYKGIGVASFTKDWAPTDESEGLKAAPKTGETAEAADAGAEMAAKFFVRQSEVPLRPDDAAAYSKLQTDAERVRFIVERIEQERTEYTLEKFEYLRNAVVDGRKAAEAELQAYGYKEAEVPIQRLNLMGHYDFTAASAVRQAPAMSTSFADSGEIFVDMSVLKNLPVEEQQETVQHIVTHHVIQLAASTNYWQLKSKDKNQPDVYVPRRVGLQFTRLSRTKKGESDKVAVEKGTAEKGAIITENYLVERGRPLNEAVIEQLTLASLRRAERESGKQSKRAEERSLELYKPERHVLNTLCTKLNVPFEKFAEAFIDRRKLPELVEAVERRVVFERKGKKSGPVRVRPEFFPLLLEVMDYESEHNQRDYNKTLSLINGQEFGLPADAVREFAPTLLDKQGRLKEAYATYYRIFVGENQPRGKGRK